MDYLTQLTKEPLLTRAQEYDLTARYRRGDMAAKDKLVMSNMRLVVNIARMFYGQGVDIEDLVQAGSIGLIRAVEKFQPERGFGFSTYASFWITNHIQRALTGGGLEIRVPQDVAARRRQIDRARNEKPDASDLELAAAVGCSMSQFETATQSGRVVTSLNRERLGAEEGHTPTLADVIPDGGAGIEDQLAAAERERELETRPLGSPYRLMFGEPRIQAVLDTLPAIQRRILELRYGFDGEPRSLERVAQIVGNYSGQWIHQMEQRALESFREVLGVDGS